MTVDLPKSYISLPLTDEHYHAIGHVAAMWSTVEAQFQWMVWRLMRVAPNVGQLTTAALRLETLFTIIEILVETQDLPTALREEIAGIIAETNRLSKRRNTVVHTQWNFGDTPESAATYSFKLRSKPEEFTAAAIEDIALEINLLLGRSLSAGREIVNALLRTPPKLPRRG